MATGFYRYHMAYKLYTNATNYYTHLYNRCSGMRHNKLPWCILVTGEHANLRPLRFKTACYRDKKDIPQRSKLGVSSGTARWWVLRTPQGYPICIAPQGLRDSQEGEREVTLPKPWDTGAPCIGKGPSIGFRWTMRTTPLPRRTCGRNNAPSPNAGIQRSSGRGGTPDAEVFQSLPLRGKRE